MQTKPVPTLRSSLSAEVLTKPVPGASVETLHHGSVANNFELPRTEEAQYRLPISKRLVDIVVSATALTLLLPLLITIWACVRLQDGGPALFRQLRGGYRGEPFVIFKFRTMSVQDNGRKIMQTKRNDPRVTTFGRFLRRTSLDELPQLLNVLRGDMSLVGPRPHAVAHDLYYSERVENYGLRFATKPGITGLAQISGCRGEIRTLADMERRVGFDIEYAETWSLGLDIKILFSTALFVLLHKNAY